MAGLVVPKALDRKVVGWYSCYGEVALVLQTLQSTVMATVSWLHLSDWHHKYPISRDRKRKRTQLLKDIERITGSLGELDFILFSGDITHSGAKEEFNEVKAELINPIRAQVGSSIPMYCIPGNHDIQWSEIANIAAPIKNQLANLKSPESWYDFNNTVSEPAIVRELNKPFSNYFDFLSDLGCPSDRSKLHSVHKIEKGGIKLGLMCINTAWNSARFNLQHREPPPDATPRLWDYGLLRITEAQLQGAIDELGPVDLGLLMMHHPLHWIDEFERAKLEHMLFDSCHVIIHGHEHRPNTSRMSSAFGDLVFIPAGATYTAPTPEDPNYTSAYNITTIDTETFVGTVRHRIWADVKGRWEPDERFWLDGESQFLLARKKDYDLKRAHKAIINAQKQYIGALGNRPIKYQEISIRHDEISVGAEKFIKHRFKVRICLHAGPPEKFQWRTAIDPLIAQHPSEKVRKAMYKMLKSPGSVEKVKVKDTVEFRWQTLVGPNEECLEYQYEKLELPNNALLIGVLNLTDRIKLSIKQAQGYRYEIEEIGGFPKLQQASDDDIFSLGVDTRETASMILPSQTCLIQWRPEHAKMAPKGAGERAAPKQAKHRRQGR